MLAWSVKISFCCLPIRFSISKTKISSGGSSGPSRGGAPPENFKISKPKIGISGGF